MRAIAAILLMPILAFSLPKTPSEDSRVRSHLATFLQVEGQRETNNEVLSPFLDRLAEKQDGKNDHWFLKHVFARTHNRFLKNYQPYSKFSEIFSTGAYSCLTATALYAVILEQLGYDYSVIETNYHIFILTETSKGQVLLETTDPLNGFITEPLEIENTLNKYITRTPVSGAYAFNTTLFREVELNDVPGLLHYNIAVDHFNKRELVMAVSHLEKSLHYYHSERLNEFAEVMVNAVIESDLTLTEKESLISRLRKLKHDDQPILAASR